MDHLSLAMWWIGVLANPSRRGGEGLERKEAGRGTWKALMRSPHFFMWEEGYSALNTEVRSSLLPQNSSWIYTVKTDTWTYKKVLSFCRTLRYNPKCLSFMFACLQLIYFYGRFIFLTHKMGMKCLLAVLSERSRMVHGSKAISMASGQNQCSMVWVLIVLNTPSGGLTMPLALT